MFRKQVLESLFNIIPIWIWNKETNEVYWSPAFYELLGYEDQEFEATFLEWESRLHSEDKSRVLKCFKCLDECTDCNNKPYIDYRLSLKDGTCRWFRAQKYYEKVNGEIIRVVECLEDINDLYEEKKQLELKNKEIHSILEAGTDGYWDWDIVNNTEYLSPKFKASLGYEDHEIPNSPESWQKLIFEEDLDLAINNATLHCNNSDFPYYQEVRYKHKTGKTVYIICRGSAFRNKDNKAIRLVGTHTDITALRQTQEELIGKHKQLQQFTYAVSHDLQEPLRVIHGYSDLLGTMDLDINPEAQSYLDWIVDGANRMSNMISDLLIYSRLQNKIKFTSVSMQASFDRAVNNLNEKIKETGATVKCGRLPAVLGVQSQIDRLLQNLIDNALKYRRSDEPPHVYFYMDNSNSNVTFALSDNGIGIKEKYFDKIFNVFKRLHAPGRYEGTGMGLAICKQTIELHGGKIWLESELGKGSTFYFTLESDKNGSNY